MRLAIISDIHSNLTALEAVIADIARQSVDQTVCLGDVVASGPQPGAVVALLQQHAGAVVMGNTDAFILDPQMTHDADNETRRWEIIDRWCAEQLAPDDLLYMRTFQPLIDLDLDPGRLLAFHGSPRSFHDRILATTPEDVLDHMLDGAGATVLAGGHTHIQMFRRHGSSIILNPGSVGMPYQIARDGSILNPPWAEYAILQSEDGHLSVDLRRVPLDRAEVARAILESNIPYATWLAEGWK